MHWNYKGKPYEKLTDNVIGFVYLIYYEDETMYIGKKLAASLRKKNFGKKKLATLTDKRMKKYEHIMTEHKWQDYEGSTTASEGKTIRSKVILHLCKDKTSLTYLEAAEQFNREVLFKEEYLNDNILGSFFSGKVDYAG